MRRTPVESLEPRTLFAAGLAAQYFDNVDLTDLKVSRTDSQINFNWGTGSPSSSIGADTFSARWTGQITVPTSGAYNFIAHVDDGVRVWVNNQLIINQWKSSAPVDHTSSSITLQANIAYDLKVEYFENNGGAQLQLLYKTASQAKTLVPAAWLSNGTSSPTPTPTPTSTLRINSGGGAFKDSNGQNWLADTYVTGGTPSNSAYAVDNTVDDAIYFARRWGDFNYAIPVTNGTYTVKLHFAEPTVMTLNTRVFNVFAENAKVLSNYDTYADGAAKAAQSRTFGVTVSDGKLNLNFVTVKTSAIVSGIEVIPGAPPAVVPMSWTPSMVENPVARVEPASIQVGNKLFSMGGYLSHDLDVTSRVDILNLDTMKWSSGAPLPLAQTHLAIATDGVYIYAVAGQVGPAFAAGTNRSFKYHIATNKWTEFVALPEVRYAGTLSYFNGRLDYFGGDLPDRSTASKSHWSIATTGATQWTQRADLPVAADHLMNAVVGNVIYLIGGEQNHGDRNGVGTFDQLDNVYAYNPATDTYTTKAPIPVPRSHAEASTFVINGKIVILGGMISGNSTTSSVVRYDPATNVWSTLSPLPEARKGMSAAWYNNKFFITAGQIGVGGLLKSSFTGVFL